MVGNKILRFDRILRLRRVLHRRKIEWRPQLNLWNISNKLHEVVEVRIWIQRGLKI